MERIKKRCTKCSKVKLLIEFDTNSSTYDGLYSWCKSCQRIYKSFHTRNYGKNAQTNKVMQRLQMDRHERNLAAKRRSRMKYMYGITPEQYDKILEEQNYLCALCGCELTHDAVPSIDHSHTLNEMRGIVCRKCNLMIGLAEDNPRILYLGIKYLHQSS